MEPSVSPFMGNPMIHGQLNTGGWTSMVHGNNFFAEIAQSAMRYSGHRHTRMLLRVSLTGFCQYHRQKVGIPIKKRPTNNKLGGAGRAGLNHADCVISARCANQKTDSNKLMNVKIKMLTLTGVLLVAGLAARADAPKDIFAHSCAKCHGEDGTGQTKIGQF